MKSDGTATSYVYHNPSDIPLPLGAYSQGLEIPPNSRLLFVSGQTPMDKDGSIPECFEDQAHLVWRRIGAVLSSAGMEYRHICRVVTYLVNADDSRMNGSIRTQYLGDNRPACVGVVVKRLFQEGYRLEVEVVAARGQPNE